jgi:hypothetical protein
MFLNPFLFLIGQPRQGSRIRSILLLFSHICPFCATFILQRIVDFPGGVGSLAAGPKNL